MNFWNYAPSNINRFMPLALYVPGTRPASWWGPERASPAPSQPTPSQPAPNQHTVLLTLRPDSPEIDTILVQGSPLLDVRAPGEFHKGALPGAINLPLLDDEQRHQVGLCYQLHGQSAALELGHTLISGQVRQNRIEAWSEFVRAHPEGYLYCLRGGLRSRIAQQWLEQAGLPYPRLRGGYKAARKRLIVILEQILPTLSWVVVGGLTGTGKTDFLKGWRASVDLEALAHHRGSSFGKMLIPQPGQIDFEHALAQRALQLRQTESHELLVEDESEHIGHCALPRELYRALQQAPLLWLEDQFAARVERILNLYVVEPLQQLCRQSSSPDMAFDDLGQGLRQGLAGIARRLGGERHQRLLTQLDHALQVQRTHGQSALHRVWISSLLREYYDPMYLYQRERKAQRICCAGPASVLREWLKNAGLVQATVRVTGGF